MKVEFYFPEDPITGYDGSYRLKLEQSEVNKTIKEKVHNKIVEIPCIPTKEMQVDISSFAEIFGFSKEEMEWIEDLNQYFFITNIFIKPTHLEVWLEYKVSF
jgi:hypothetical protein